MKFDRISKAILNVFRSTGKGYQITEGQGNLEKENSLVSTVPANGPVQLKNRASAGKVIYDQIQVLYAGIILCMCPVNERRCYNVSYVTWSLIGWAHAQNDPCV